MKKYLLDTNICVYFLRGKYSLDQKIRQVGWDSCYISEITVAELKYGAELGRRKSMHQHTQELDSMVTENVKDFKNILNIRIENWIER